MVETINETAAGNNQLNVPFLFWERGFILRFFSQMAEMHDSITEERLLSLKKIVGMYEFAHAEAVITLEINASEKLNDDCFKIHITNDSLVARLQAQFVARKIESLFSANNIVVPVVIGEACYTTEDQKNDFESVANRFSLQPIMFVKRDFLSQSSIKSSEKLVEESGKEKKEEEVIFWLLKKLSIASSVHQQDDKSHDAKFSNHLRRLDFDNDRVDCYMGKTGKKQDIFIEVVKVDKEPPSGSMSESMADPKPVTSEDDLQFTMDDVPSKPLPLVAPSMSSLVAAAPAFLPSRPNPKQTAVIREVEPLAEKLIKQYITQRKADERKYKRSINFFCREWGFGYSRDKKIAAAEFVLDVLRRARIGKEMAITEEEWKQHKGACKQGELGELCKEFKVIELIEQRIGHNNHKRPD